MHLRGRIAHLADSPVQAAASAHAWHSQARNYMGGRAGWHRDVRGGLETPGGALQGCQGLCSVPSICGWRLQ